MNYQRIYNQIIERAKNEEISRIVQKKDKISYFEGHHIVPKCLGGTGKMYRNYIDTNVALLTAREHFICHWLLIKVYPDNQELIYAFWSMCNKNAKRNNCLNISSRIYQESKENFQKIHRIYQSKRLLGRKMSQLTKNKISKANIGRKLTDVQKLPYKYPKKKVICPHCNKEGGSSNMTRYHFDNCKKKQGNENIKFYHPKGRIVTQETRNKISAGNKGKLVSIETRKKMSRSLLGHKKNKR